jgi:hypothetical protein
MIECINTEVTLRGKFDDAQQEGPAQMAERWPARSTLAKGVQIFDSVSFET